MGVATKLAAERFSRVHLRELSALVHRETRLPADWQRVAPGTLLEGVRGDDERTSSCGIFVMHTVLATGDRFAHRLTFVDARPDPKADEATALAAAFAKWLPGTTKVEQGTGKLAGATVTFAFAPAEEQSFQGTPFEPSESALADASRALGSAAKPRAWWRVW